MEKAMYQVALMNGKRVIKKELFRNYEAAMAFFDANRDKYTCEFRDLKAYEAWSYKAS
jgi:hypothetical protein